MPDPEVLPLLGVGDHHVALAALGRLGWVRCGQGDWAYAYRSPSGRLVARVSPFEPAYGYFVDLCERCFGNRYVPRIELATRLQGGGHLAVLEYLSPPDRTVVEWFLHAWDDPAGADDADLRALRQEVTAIDAWGRRNVRWWVGIDLGDRHVLTSSDGIPKVIDLFGWSSVFLDDLVDDPQAFAALVPPEQRQYLLDMPDLQADDHPAGYIARIRAALSAIAGS